MRVKTIVDEDFTNYKKPAMFIGTISCGGCLLYTSQGSGVYLELYSSYYGYTYLCYSSYPELYGG